jgi:hypothetical protein
LFSGNDLQGGESPKIEKPRKKVLNICPDTPVFLPKRAIFWRLNSQVIAAVLFNPGRAGLILPPVTPNPSPGGASHFLAAP